MNTFRFSFSNKYVISGKIAAAIMPKFFISPGMVWSFVRHSPPDSLPVVPPRRIEPVFDISEQFSINHRIRISQNGRRQKVLLLVGGRT